MRVNKKIIGLILLVMSGVSAAAETAAVEEAMQGGWVINDELSDDTDKQVEQAIKKAGGRPDSGGKKGKGRYRGGPADQELYDRISYDDVLTIEINEPEVRFGYADGFERRFYTDGRSRSVSAASGRIVDYSFGGWSGDKLNVESRPRDGGWTRETYGLETGEDGQQRLRVELQLKPLTFDVPIEIVRVYDRRKL